MSWLGGLVDRAKGWLDRSPEPVADCTDAVRQTRFDAALFDQLLGDAPALAGVVADLHTDYAFTDDLVRDTLMAFYQGSPMVRPAGEMHAGHLANHAVAANLRDAPQTALTRTYTQHDKYGSAMATIAVADKVRAYLTEHAEVVEAAAAAEQARAEQDAARQALSQALAAAEQGAGDAQGEGAGDGTGEASGEGTGQGQGAAAQAAGQALEAALDALQAATDAAGQATQRALTEGELARAALRAPVDAAVREAGASLAREAEMFAGWGIEPGQLERMDFTERAALARRLSGHRLAAFVALLGRWRAMQRAQYAKRTTAARDEVHDVELSGNLPDVIASEYVHLGTDLGRIDFLTRMSERHLISRKYRGDERSGQGAIICLVDTSSSMGQVDRGGVTREAFAKGMALAMLEQARAERRDYVGILFSSPGRHQVFRFPKGQGELAEVLAYTETFLGGGTDFQGPLELALDILEAELSEHARAKGDLVLLTDDECRVEAGWQEKFAARKDALGARMFGLSLGITQRGGTLASLCDDVRAVTDFADPLQAADIVRTV